MWGVIVVLNFGVIRLIMATSHDIFDEMRILMVVINVPFKC